jgi:hypothetical protein
MYHWSVYPVRLLEIHNVVVGNESAATELQRAWLRLVLLAILLIQVDDDLAHRIALHSLLIALVDPEQAD